MRSFSTTDPDVGTVTDEGSTPPWNAGGAASIAYSPGSRCSAKEPSGATRTVTGEPPPGEKTSALATAGGSHGSPAGQVAIGPRSRVPLTLMASPEPGAVAVGWPSGLDPHADEATSIASATRVVVRAPRMSTIVPPAKRNGAGAAGPVVSAVAGAYVKKVLTLVMNAVLSAAVPYSSNPKGRKMTL